MASTCTALERLQDEIRVTFAFITPTRSLNAENEESRTLPPLCDTTAHMLQQVGHSDSVTALAPDEDATRLGRLIVVKLYNVHRNTTETQLFLCRSPSCCMSDLHRAMCDWLGTSHGCVYVCLNRDRVEAKTLPLVSHVLHGSDAIPDVVFCQCTISYGSVDINVKRQWLVVNVLLLRASGDPIIGHLPLVIPFTASITSEMCVRQIVSLCRCSWKHTDYMLAHAFMMTCNIHRGQIILHSMADHIASASQVALVLPPIEIGDVVCLDAHDATEKTCIPEQGVIVRQRVKNGVALFDVQCMHTYSIREGVTCLHVTPL